MEWERMKIADKVVGYSLGEYHLNRREDGYYDVWFGDEKVNGKRLHLGPAKALAEGHAGDRKPGDQQGSDPTSATTNSKPVTESNAVLAPTEDEGENEGVTFRIRQDDEGEYYAHVSRPGRPGLEMDHRLSEEVARAMVLAEWPKAVEDGADPIADPDTLAKPLPMPAAESRTKKPAFRVGRSLTFRLALGRSF